MNTQEIYKKRIEEAAHQYIQSDAVAPENMKLAFGDFINGAKFSLQNQWISVEEALPSYGSLCLVDGKNGLKLSIYMNVFVDAGYITQRIDNVTHWMAIPEMKGGEK